MLGEDGIFTSLLATSGFSLVLRVYLENTTAFTLSSSTAFRISPKHWMLPWHVLAWEHPILLSDDDMWGDSEDGTPLTGNSLRVFKREIYHF